MNLRNFVSIVAILVLFGCQKKNSEGGLYFEWLETGLCAHNPYKVFDGEKYYYFKILVKNHSDKNYCFTKSNTDFRIKFNDGNKIDTLKFFLSSDFNIKANTTDTMKFVRTKINEFGIINAFQFIENLGLKGSMIYKYSIIDSSNVKYFEVIKAQNHKLSVKILDGIYE